MDGWIEKLGMIGGVVMPFFNIPLIIHIWKSKSSEGLSLSWALGVWVCILLMTPQAIRSEDITFRAFGIVNIIFFSIVVFFILKYRRPSGQNNRGK